MSRRRRAIARVALCAALLALAACLDFTDGATRIAYQLEDGAKRVGPRDGDRLTLDDVSPAKDGECDGDYKAQFDKVGALIVWCTNGSGPDSSHSTTYHGNFADTAATFIVEKQHGAPLSVELERHGERVLIVGVR